MLQSEKTAAHWQQAFGRSAAEGFIELAACNEPLTSSLAFARAFTRDYLTALCHAPKAAADEFPDVPSPSASEWQGWIDNAMPFRGMEFFNAALAEKLWTETHAAVRHKVAESGGLATFLHKINPAWRSVGRVTFHLADNKKNPERPFAFISTYAVKISDIGRVQHMPLKRALSEYAGAKNRAALLRLLEPIQAAVEKCAFVKELYESGRIYQPLALTARDAYRFLRDIPLLEECGLIVRMPDWWNPRKPPRPVVSIALGDRQPSRLGANAMLDFRMSVTLDGEALSAEEMTALLEAGCGLVSLRGKWVEVNREQLTQALAHWEKIEQAAAQGGVSFADAMRYLSGAAIGGETETETESVKEWSGINAGQWLNETLARLRQPEDNADDLPCAATLQADLRPYQKNGVHWLHFIASLGLGGCLADDMGLGKTIQTLALLLWLKQESGRHTPSLLIAPASLLTNWQDEARRFTPSLRFLIAHPAYANAEILDKLEKKPAGLLDKVDLVATTYGMASRMAWLADTEWSVVILDEAQAIKNPGTKQTRAVKKLKAMARLALTGTPVENRIGDLWSIFDFINPGLLGSAKAFSNFVVSREDRPDAYAPVRRLTRPYILRRLKTDKKVIADLPEKTIMSAYCDLSRDQAAAYAAQVLQLKQALEGEADGDPMKRRGLILTNLMRFKQICNHPAQASGDGDFSENRSGKFQRLRELCTEIAERQDKVLVFTQYREITEPLSAFLSGVFKRPGLILHGGTPVKRRRSLVSAFQRDEGPPFFVLSIKAGGTGLNLTQASHVIHFDRWWNPAVENQATDRAFRIGQKKNVIVHNFICRGTVEENINDMLEDKRELADQVLKAGGEKLLTEMSDKELLRFVALKLKPQ